MNDTAPTSALATRAASDPALAFGTHISPALRVLLDDRLFDRAKIISGYMAKADGMIPKHLLGKQEACFAVVMRSLTWGLDPYAVAVSTYQTPGGSVGFEGKLVQAILENSGALDGPVRFDHYGVAVYKLENGDTVSARTIDHDLINELKLNGAKLVSRKDWSHLSGKFEIKQGSTGKPYPSPTWNRKDADGLGVRVRAKVHGEIEERIWEFDLIQAFPLNSTLWATDPKSQVCYTAVRRFANLAAPGLFFGVPFDREDVSTGMMDVTPTPPRPTRASSTVASQQRTPTPASRPMTTDVDPEPPEEDAGQLWEITDAVGEVRRLEEADAAVTILLDAIADAASRGEGPLEDLWRENATFLTTLRESNLGDLADKLNEAYGKAADGIKAKAREAAAQAEAARKRQQAEADAKPKAPESQNAPAGAQGKPAEGQSAPATQQASAEPPEAQRAPAQRQQRQPAPMKSPLVTKRLSDWPSWVDWVIKLIGNTAPEALDGLHNTYKAEIEELQDFRTADHQRVIEAFDLRRAPPE